MQTTELATKKEDDVFLKMERMDEIQIQNEIEGMVQLKDYFYEFPGTVGISWVGIKEARRLMSELGNPITIQEIEFEETPEAYVYTAWAKLMQTGERSPGVAEQSKLMKAKGEMIPDPFARRKALSKAKRNAIRDFIPEPFIKQIYAKWIESKREGFPTKEQMKSVGRSEAKEVSSPPNSSEKNGTVIYDGTKAGKLS